MLHGLYISKRVLKSYGAIYILAGMSKRTSYNKIYQPDVRMRPHLPRGRVFPVHADGKKLRPRA
jgi:hypothetical protein